MKPNKTGEHLQAKKNYVQAVRESIRTFHENTINYNYSFEMVVEATHALQRLGIEPNYSLIVKEIIDDVQK